MRVWTCFLSVTFFSKYCHVRLQTLYLQVNSFPEILDSSGVWGSMLTSAYFFFSTWCWGGDRVLWVHANLVGNMAAFVARFGSPITNPNLLHFGLKFLFWRLSEDVRTHCCQRTSTTLHNQNPKYAIEQKKNRPLQVRTHNGQKKICPYGFPGIYTLFWMIIRSVGQSFRWSVHTDT